MSTAASSPPLRELTARQWQWIGGGYAMSLGSLAGQTVFIAQFNTSLRETFGLSHGEFGFLYTAATLASSVCLIWAGSLADKFPPRQLGVAVLVGLIIVAAGMSLVPNVAVLGLTLFGLRFFGQGMLVHIAVTTMSRWFNRFRGRAISFVQLGFPTGESVMPFVTTLAISAFGWRQVWLFVAAALALFFVPAVMFLFRDPPDGKKAQARGETNPDGMAVGTATGADWTRGKVLRDRLFYPAIVGIMGAPTIGTLFIFHQAHLTELKGWDLTMFTAFFPLLATMTVLGSIVSGNLVDRFGAWRMMPSILLPLGMGCMVVALLSPPWAIPVLFVFFGASFGFVWPVVGALWAEMYGTTHIGSVRALATSAFVFASAIGPGIAGGLIDMGIDLNIQAYFYAAFCFGASIVYLLLQPAFKARVAAIIESAG